MVLEIKLEFRFRMPLIRAAGFHSLYALLCLSYSSSLRCATLIPLEVVMNVTTDIFLGLNAWRLKNACLSALFCRDGNPSPDLGGDCSLG